MEGKSQHVEDCLAKTNLSWGFARIDSQGFYKAAYSWNLRQGAPSPFQTNFVQLRLKAPPKQHNKTAMDLHKAKTEHTRRKRSASLTNAKDVEQKNFCPLELVFFTQDGKAKWKLPLVLIESVVAFDESETSPVQLRISSSGRRSSRSIIARIQDDFDLQEQRYSSSTVELFFEWDYDRDKFGTLLRDILSYFDPENPIHYLKTWMSPKLAVGSLCIHHGFIKMKNSFRWSNRHLVLFYSKLLITENENSEIPLLIINLNEFSFKLSRSNRNIFKIRTKSMKCVFEASGTEDILNWKDAFEKREMVESHFSSDDLRLRMSTPTNYSSENIDRKDSFDDHFEDANGKLQSTPQLSRKNSANNVPSKKFSPSNFRYDSSSYHENPVRFFSDEFDAHWLKNQSNFFPLVRDKLSYITIPFSTNIKSLSNWLKMSQVPFAVRGRRTRIVDTYLEIYSEIINRCKVLVKDTYLFCMDDSYHAGNSQIFFAFPGFDTQLFNVGQCALVPVWNLFRNYNQLSSFQEQDWTGALQSNSVAKELMQCFPTVTGSHDTKQVAAISHNAALEQLRSLILTNYLSGNVDLISLNKLELFTFQDARIFLNQSTNQGNLEVFIDAKFAFNPSLDLMRKYINVGKYDRFQPDKVVEHIENKNFPYHLPPFEVDYIIADHMYWLYLIRVAHEERFKALQDLKAAVDWWKCSHDEDKTRPRVEIMNDLSKEIELEELSIKSFLKLLPSCQSLESKDLVSDVLIYQRKQVEEILRCSTEQEMKETITKERLNRYYKLQEKIKHCKTLS
jgi:hypothetical protein